MIQFKFKLRNPKIEMLMPVISVFYTLQNKFWTAKKTKTERGWVSEILNVSLKRRQKGEQNRTEEEGTETDIKHIKADHLRSGSLRCCQYGQELWEHLLERLLDVTWNRIWQNWWDHADAGRNATTLTTDIKTGNYWQL